MARREDSTLLLGTVVLPDVLPRPWLPLDEAVVVVDAADEPEAEAEDAFGGGESERDGAEAAAELAAPELLFVDGVLAPAGGGDDSESETDVGGDNAPVVDVGSGGDIESMVSE